MARTRGACMQLVQCQREQLKGLCLHQHAATRRTLALKPPILSLLLPALHQYRLQVSIMESTPMVGEREQEMMRQISSRSASF